MVVGPFALRQGRPTELAAIWPTGELVNVFVRLIMRQTGQRADRQSRRSGRIHLNTVDPQRHLAPGVAGPVALVGSMLCG